MIATQSYVLFLQNQLSTVHVSKYVYGMKVERGYFSAEKEDYMKRHPQHNVDDMSNVKYHFFVKIA